MHALYRLVVMKRELSQKAKLAVFRSIFVPVLTYGHVLGNDRKNAIASASVQNKIFAKNQRSYFA